MDVLFQRLQACEGFHWDDANRRKNEEKHAVACGEAEEIFFRRPLCLLEDPAHSASEERVHAFGTTCAGRPLALTFTIRGKKIRIISARDQNRENSKTMDSKDKPKWVARERANSNRHLDLKAARPAPDMPRLKPSTATMNLRVPEALLFALKREANRRDVPYQSLVKILLDEKLAELGA